MIIVILGVHHDFWPSPWFCVTAVIIGRLCTKSTQWSSFSDANFAVQLMVSFSATRLRLRVVYDSICLFIQIFFCSLAHKIFSFSWHFDALCMATFLQYFCWCHWTPWFFHEAVVILHIYHDFLAALVMTVMFHFYSSLWSYQSLSLHVVCVCLCVINCNSKSIDLFRIAHCVKFLPAILL